MRLNLFILVFLGSLMWVGSQKSSPWCQCDCEHRVAIPEDMGQCFNLRSLKTGGWVTADQNHMFTPDVRRYIYVTAKSKQSELRKYSRFRLYSRPKYNNSYAIRQDVFLKEFLYAGPDLWARSTEKRYIHGYRRDYYTIPFEGYWQFIPDPKNEWVGYRIRNAWSGEYLYVDDENHYQVSGAKRLYLWRHRGHYQKDDYRNWFELVKCLGKYDKDPGTDAIPPGPIIYY